MYKPDLDPSVREQERQRFADYVCEQAYQSPNAAALLSTLESSLPKGFMEPAGLGRTRRVYATQLGVVVKIQRDATGDPESEQETAERFGEKFSADDLRNIRRVANLLEAKFMSDFPQMTPALYGAAFNFGQTETHASVIVAESCTSLDRYLPGDGKGIVWDDIAFDERGKLWVFDPRLTTQKRPAYLRSVEQMFGAKQTLHDTGLWLGNLGVSPDGRFVILDANFVGTLGEMADVQTFTPSSLLVSRIVPDQQQERDYAAHILARYLKRKEVLLDERNG